MTHIFIPYSSNLIAIYVKLTGKVYEIGLHQYFKQHKIIECIDENGKIHEAFEDELFKI